MDNVQITTVMHKEIAMLQFSKITIFIFLVAFSSLSFSEPPKASKLQILTEVAKALGELGDSVVKITDGVKHVVVTGGEGVSFVLAKKTKSELKELSAVSTQFAAQQNIRVVQSIDEYLEYPNTRDWPVIQQKLSDVLLRGTELLSEWNEERSDFIVESSYIQLVESLNARVSILQKLSSMEAPTTKKELEALSEVNEKYKALIKQFKNAVQELNTYIKSNA
jgi:sporulation protein YlmC with PRC-barrel domain